MLNVLSTLKNQETLEMRVAKQEGREPRVYHGVFSTHPDGDTRLQQVVSEARQLQAAGANRVERDRYLSYIDGMVVGDSSAEGFVRGNTFYHPELGFGVKFPPGWSVKNYPDRLEFIAPGGKAMMQMGAEDLNKRIPPRQFMVERMGLKRMQYDGRINPAGLEGYTAVAPARTSRGSQDARFSVIYFNNKAYIFGGLVKDAASTTAYDNAFLDVANSFRPLSATEQQSLKPLRLKVTKAGSGDTFSKLAAGSPYPTNAEARLRLLNGFFSGGEAAPGAPSNWLSSRAQHWRQQQPRPR
jgi:predicted Zn-dependent protease